MAIKIYRYDSAAKLGSWYDMDDAEVFTSPELCIRGEMDVWAGGQQAHQKSCSIRYIFDSGYDDTEWRYFRAHYVVPLTSEYNKDRAMVRMAADNDRSNLEGLGGGGTPYWTYHGYMRSKNDAGYDVEYGIVDYGTSDRKKGRYLGIQVNVNFGAFYGRHYDPVNEEWDGVPQTAQAATHTVPDFTDWWYTSVNWLGDHLWKRTCPLDGRNLRNYNPGTGKGWCDWHGGYIAPVNKCVSMSFTGGSATNNFGAHAYPYGQAGVTYLTSQYTFNLPGYGGGSDWESYYRNISRYKITQNSKGIIGGIYHDSCYGSWGRTIGGWLDGLDWLDMYSNYSYYANGGYGVNPEYSNLNWAFSGGTLALSHTMGYGTYFGDPGSRWMNWYVPNPGPPGGGTNTVGHAAEPTLPGCTGWTEYTSVPPHPPPSLTGVEVDSNFYVWYPVRINWMELEYEPPIPPPPPPEEPQPSWSCSDIRLFGTICDDKIRTKAIKPQKIDDEGISKRGLFAGGDDDVIENLVSGEFGDSMHGHQLFKDLYDEWAQRWYFKTDLYKPQSPQPVEDLSQTGAGLVGFKTKTSQRSIFPPRWSIDNIDEAILVLSYWMKNLIARDLSPVVQEAMHTSGRMLNLTFVPLPDNHLTGKWADGAPVTEDQCSWIVAPAFLWGFGGMHFPWIWTCSTFGLGTGGDYTDTTMGKWGWSDWRTFFEKLVSGNFLFGRWLIFFVVMSAVDIVGALLQILGLYCNYHITGSYWWGVEENEAVKDHSTYVGEAVNRPEYGYVRSEGEEVDGWRGMKRQPDTMDYSKINWVGFFADFLSGGGDKSWNPYKWDDSEEE